MNSINVSNAEAIKTAKSLRKLYFSRTVFSVIWVVLVSMFAKTNAGAASILLIIYPAWDVLATFIDIRSQSAQTSKTPQYVNVGIGVITTIGVIFALQKGVPYALIVFGVWAIVTGLIQLILGLRRRKQLDGQWPMILSGGQSVLAGGSFIAFAHKPDMGIANLAGYSAFGAFYFLIAAIRLSKLYAHLVKFAALTEKDIADSRMFWKPRKIKKGDFFNMQFLVCNDLGLVTKGIFRIYYSHPETSEEINIFFFSEEQFLVSFRSFITRNACHYFIQAMEDSEIVYISHHDLNSLYNTHPNWARFGRLLAEQFFINSQSRAEELLFLTHEQRFIRLLDNHPNIINRIPAYHISSYLGIKNPSLSRLRKRINR